MNMTIIMGALESGCIFAILSLGIYITFHVLNFPDLSVDGTFSLGCVISSIFTLHGHPLLGIFAAMIAGSLAGFTTGFLHTKIKVHYILAGILTMTALYSINLRIGDGQPYLSLFQETTIFSLFDTLLTHLSLAVLFPYSKFILLILILLSSALFLSIFFKTQTGLAIRATGDNETMVKASSINTDAMKLCALALANALVAFSASLFAQYQQFYDITQGIGMMVIGLSGIIIGEAILGNHTMKRSFIALMIGSFLYRLLLTYALSLGMNPNDWKLVSAIFVGIIISLPTIKSYLGKRRKSC